jgi:hypothetical protein
MPLSDLGNGKPVESAFVHALHRNGQSIYALPMGTSAWFTGVIGLAGVLLGGLASFAVSHQQIREARIQRVDDARLEREQQSRDRRFQAFADFINGHRAVQHALQLYYSQAPIKPGVSDIFALLQSGYNSSAMVFLVLGTERTREACIEVSRVLQHTQHIVSEHNASPAEDDPWPELNATMGRVMREFQNAARAELDVDGPESPWIEPEQVK